VGFEMALTKIYLELIKSNKLDVMLIRDHDAHDVKEELSHYDWFFQQKPLVREKHIDVGFLTSPDENMMEDAFYTV
jgi:hypothetical protein